MIARIQKWGNSQGLRLSKDVLSDAHLEVGDALDVSVSEGCIVLAPARRVRGVFELDQLVREIPSDYEPVEVDWGPPTGREVW